MDTAEQGIRNLARHKENSHLEAQERFRKLSKEQLINTISKKFSTATIGPLSILEQYFGKLWGQGKPSHVLTDDELAWRAIKELVRTEVLNLGNNQKRAAVAAIHEYEVSWERYHVECRPIEGRTTNA